MVHWYPKMGVVKESGRGQLKIFPRATYISPPHQKTSSYAPVLDGFLSDKVYLAEEKELNIFKK